MVIRTCPRTLEKQKQLIAKMIYAQELPEDEAALTEGLLFWLQEICDCYKFEQKSIEISYQLDNEVLSNG